MCPHYSILLIVCMCVTIWLKGQVQFPIILEWIHYPVIESYTCVLGTDSTERICTRCLNEKEVRCQSWEA